MIYEHTSYRTFLKEVLAERIRKNPSYSLRAMAKQLNRSSSSLSEVMNGLGNFSITAAREVGFQLGLSHDETEYFCILVQLATSRDPRVRDSLLERIKSLNPKRVKAHDLSVDLFKQRSEWYYSAILGMVHLSNFDFTTTQIAKRLGISKIEAEVAVDRLVRLDLVDRDKDGKISPLHDQLIFKSDASSNIALRTFFRQMLHKASVALETQSTKERVSGFETIPIANEAIPEAKEIIENFFQAMIKLGNKYPKKKNVYHLIVHFFNLTNGKG